MGSGVSNPTDATVTPAGQTLYTYTPAPALSATQALQVPPVGREPDRRGLGLGHELHGRRGRGFRPIV